MRKAPVKKAAKTALKKTAKKKAPKKGLEGLGAALDRAVRRAASVQTVVGTLVVPAVLRFLDPAALRECSPVQAYWLQVREIAKQLDPEAAARDIAGKKEPWNWDSFLAASTKEIFITSNLVPRQNVHAGRIFSTPPMLAAQCIVNNTHHLSHPADIAEWQADQRDRRKKEVVVALGDAGWKRVAGLQGAGAYVSGGAVRATVPIPPVAPEPERILVRARKWFLKLYVTLSNHPRVEALKLKFYRPTPDNDDWLLDPAKRAKVSQRLADELEGNPRAPLAYLCEHWEVILFGASIGTGLTLGALGMHGLLHGLSR